MNVRRLKWDSAFFGFEVGYMEPKNGLCTDVLDFDLVYLESDIPEYSKKFDFNDLKLLKENFVNTYTEEKVLFSKRLNVLTEPCSMNQFKEYTHMDTEIKDLVIQSGKYSRYNLDPKFPHFLFESMYIKWLEKSLDSPDIKTIGLLSSRGESIGVVIVNLTDPLVGKIDIIAINQEYRGKNIGRVLLDITDKVIYDSGRRIVDVVTQSCNASAMRFYQKNGFTIKESKYIYHLWKKQ